MNPPTITESKRSTLKVCEPKERIRYVPIEKNKDDEEIVQLSRDELVNLLEKVRQNVLYEVKNPDKDLAKKYVEEIDKFNVRLDKVDYQMPNSLRNQSILMTGQEMYTILDKFKKDVEYKVAEDRRHGINFLDPIIEKEEAEKNYQAFQSILWYYYQYYPEMYKQLIDEYNHRFHNQLLEKMGLNEQFSIKKMQQQLLQKQMKDNISLVISNRNSLDSIPRFNLNDKGSPRNFALLHKNSIDRYTDNNNSSSNNNYNQNNNNNYNRQSNLFSKMNSNDKNNMNMSKDSKFSLRNNNLQNSSLQNMRQNSNILNNNPGRFNGY